MTNWEINILKWMMLMAQMNNECFVNKIPKIFVYVVRRREDYHRRQLQMMNINKEELMCYYF